MQSFGCRLPELINSSQYAVKIYDDSAGNQYICKAEPGTAITAALWQIQKVNVTGTITTISWCDGNNEPDNVATSLAIVEALSFS